jgi:hypothetical protein
LGIPTLATGPSREACILAAGKMGVPVVQRDEEGLKREFEDA